MGLLVGTFFMLSMQGARARCTTVRQAAQARTSTRLSARCYDAVLRAGAGITCPTFQPPPCARILTAAAIALVYGSNGLPREGAGSATLSDQRRCRARVGRSIGALVATLAYPRARRDAVEAHGIVGRSLDRVVRDCRVRVERDPVSGVVLPAVGPQCAAALGPVGSLVQAERLRDCLLTLMHTWVARAAADQQPLRPNILLILTDDQRWDSLGAAQAPSGTVIMPRTLAELADSGVAFPNAYVTTPLCAPSRATILTGSYAHRTGVYKNGGAKGGSSAFDDSSTVATWLQDAGYRTGLIGKYMNGYEEGPRAAGSGPYVPPGWTEWHGMSRVSYYDYVIVEPDGEGGYAEQRYGHAEGDYLTDVLREKAKAFITRSVAASQPFFLYLAFKAPHTPWIPAPRHVGMFETLPLWRPPNYNEIDVSDKPTWLQDTPLLTPSRQAEIDGIRIRQLETLQAVDEAIGGSTVYGITGIMEHLRTLGVANDTIVIFMSDNGWYWGEHRLHDKREPYQEDIRAPLLIWFPKLAPLKRVEPRIALNIDIAPTLAELAGAPVPIDHDGVSLLPLIDGTATTWRSDFLTEGWPRGHPWATVNAGEWKYTEVPLRPGSPTTGFDTELYDLATDPYELSNVAADPANATRVAAMATRLRELRPQWPIDADSKGPDTGRD